MPKKFNKENSDLQKKRSSFQEQSTGKKRKFSSQADILGAIGQSSQSDQSYPSTTQDHASADSSSSNEEEPTKTTGISGLSFRFRSEKNKPLRKHQILTPTRAGFRKPASQTPNGTILKPLYEVRVNQGHARILSGSYNLGTPHKELDLSILTFHDHAAIDKYQRDLAKRNLVGIQEYSQEYPAGKKSRKGGASNKEIKGARSDDMYEIFGMTFDRIEKTSKGHATEHCHLQGRARGGAPEFTNIVSATRDTNTRQEVVAFIEDYLIDLDMVDSVFVNVRALLVSVGGIPTQIADFFIHTFTIVDKTGLKTEIEIKLDATHVGIPSQQECSFLLAAIRAECPRLFTSSASNSSSDTCTSSSRADFQPKTLKF